MQPTRNFSVYKSSAGSGKTYTLVREYIALALQSPAYFKHILAITFTNKAANEMKQRIVQGLIQLADPVTYSNGAIVKFMLPDLVKNTNYTVEEITEKSKSVIIRVLHEYDDFAVRTIDSFVSRIIRTFAHDLHLPVDFEIEMDRDLMLDEAVAQLIAKSGIDKELTNILVDFAEAKAEDEKSWQIEMDIKKTAEFLFSEGSFHFISQLRDIPPSRINQIAREIRLARKSFEDSIMLLGQKAWQLIVDNQIDSASFSRGKNGIGGYFFKLSKGIIDEPNSYVTATINEDKWFAAKADESQMAAITSVKDTLTSFYHQCVGLMENGNSRYTCPMYYHSSWHRVFSYDSFGNYKLNQ